MDAVNIRANDDPVGVVRRAFDEGWMEKGMIGNLSASDALLAYKAACAVRDGLRNGFARLLMNVAYWRAKEGGA